jgi:hypothetical protein
MKISKIFCGHVGYGILWFRVFGKGIKVKDLRKRPLVFSERSGYTKHFEIGVFSFGILNN